MALITVNIDVEDVESVVDVFDQIIVERSTGSARGPFTEVTTTATRIPLERTRTRYEFTDLGGRSGFYYRTRYFSTSTGRQSDASEPVEGGAPLALDVLSVRELQDHYLFGVKLTDDSGQPFPDSLYEFYIKSAVAQAEQLLDLPIVPKIFSNDASRDPDFPEERYDFFVQEYYKFIELFTNLYPVEEIYQIKLVLPNNQLVVDFPTEWFTENSDLRTGSIRVIPGRGSIGLIALGQSGSWSPTFHRFTDYLPNVFRVSYKAGFGGVGGVPHNIKDMVGMLAAFGPLNVAGDLVLGAGIAAETVNLDALSTSISTTQSATNAGYGARLTTYRAKLRAMTPEIRRYWKGIRVLNG